MHPFVGYSHISDQGDGPSDNFLNAGWCDGDDDDNDDALKVHFGERLLDRAVLYASFYNDRRLLPFNAIMTIGHAQEQQAPAALVKYGVLHTLSGTPVKRMKLNFVVQVFPQFPLQTHSEWEPT